LVERGELEQVDARAKNKSAVKRARAVIREMDDRATAAAEAMRAAELEAARIEQEERAREQAAHDAGERAAAEAAAQARAAALADEEAQRQAARTVAEQEADASRALEEAEAARRRGEEEAVARQRAEEEVERTRQRQAEQAEAQERDARARRDALTRVQQLAARIEPLPAKADLTLKAGERALRDLRAALADIPPLPSRKDYEEIVARLKAAQAALTPKVHEMREAVEWQRWANVGVQEQLCQKMEALAAVEDAEAVARQVKELQEQWRQVSDVPRQQGDALWRRFKAAHDVAWNRCAAYFAEQAEVRAANLAKKIALCEQAEALGGSSDWIRTAEAIKGLQAEWKTVGPVSRGQEKAIWERFRVACDQFFTRRQADLVERKTAWTANLAKKEALCARVEALADSTEWESASAEIKRLQAEWKTVGAVKRSRSDAIWQRFRGACDRFFGRYAQRHDLARTERVAAREAICVELESLSPVAIEGASPTQEPTTAEASETEEPSGTPGTPGTPGTSGTSGTPAPPDLLAKVRELRGRWQQELAARGVDREHAAALDERFRAAFMRLVTAWPTAFAGSDLDLDANRKRMEALVRRVEDLAHSLGGGRAADAAEAALSPTTRLAAMLKEALASNTIGGKVDDGSRLRAAAEDVRQAQAAWSRIGPVPDETRRPLAERFQRACRRITEEAGRAEAAGAAGGPGRPRDAGRAAGKPGGAARSR
jgi:hypothetical protein